MVFTASPRLSLCIALPSYYSPSTSYPERPLTTIAGVLLLTQDGLNLYDLATGALLWNTPVDIKNEPSTRWGWDVAFADEYLVLLTDGARLTKIDRKTGSTLWTMVWPDTG